MVAAFDRVKRASTQEQTDIFKQYNLFGVDQEEPVTSDGIIDENLIEKILQNTSYWDYLSQNFKLADSYLTPQVK